jgi:uncharacterized membrane protein
VKGVERFLGFIARLWQTHRGRMLGAIAGLVLGILFLTLGFLRTIFLLILVAGGYLLGGKIDSKEDLLELLDRILPPGYHK